MNMPQILFVANEKKLNTLGEICLIYSTEPWLTCLYSVTPSPGIDINKDFYLAQGNYWSHGLRDLGEFS